MNRKVEILAPAGSFECLVAALKSGADAIYVGGSKFGARANANNFTEDELKEAIDLVHLHGKHLYLTINTLLKEEEINNELLDYLLPLYEHGIDAVIVQDLGVLQFVKKHFPDLPIHGSTQMTVTNLLGAKFLESQGVERVVTSRELSISEVNEINQETNLEIESFVHGALCYAYSGQCLFSSMLGDRSGNRGQCAQPCRLPYTIDGKTDYYMSLKDICTLYEIPELIEAGVFSFKIEGRMKKPEYVASVTSMYRKYVDLYLEKGKASYKVSEEDVDILRDIFNRGDFHSGYWKQHNGKDMVTKDKPSHTGTAVLCVKKQNGRMVIGEAIKQLHKGDILEISEKGDNYTLGRDYGVGEEIELSLRKGVILTPGSILFRTRNQWLIQSIDSELEQNKLQEKINATLVFMLGSNAAIHLQMDNRFISVEGEEVQEAQKAPTSREKILEQMRKTGNTPFVFDEIEVVMDDHIFLPVQHLKQLRREALEQLEQVICEEYRRTYTKPEEGICDFASNNEKKELESLEMNAYVATREQLDVVLDNTIFTKVYYDLTGCHEPWNTKELEEIIGETHKAHKKIYFVMPHIFRKDTIEKYIQYQDKMLNPNLDGIMIRNLESFQFLKMINYTGEILLDHHVYIYNNCVYDFWSENGVHHKTHSLELTAQELKSIRQDEMELIIYGYTPNMISAQCIKKTTGKCNHKSEIIKIKDRICKEIPVKSCCDYCYNIVYSNVPLCLFDEYEEVRKIQPKSLRVNFTVENYEETVAVIDLLEKFYYDEENTFSVFESTKGHFRRGIK